MSYLPKSRAKHRHARKALILSGIFIGTALIFSWTDSFLISFASPLWKAENAVSRSLGRTFEFFSFKKTLVEENEALKARVSSLELELASLSVSRSQESSILSILGRTELHTGIATSILTHPPQSPYDILVVDAGRNDRVEAGARVFLPEGPEIGAVSEVFPSSSKVKLFSTNGEKTNAVLERHNVPVVLEGAGAGNFRIRVPRETSVETGDRILSPHIAASLLAVVEEVKLEATDAFKEILARSPANIFEVRLVIIRP